MIQPALVNEGDLTGETIHMRYADGRSKSLPLAQISVDTGLMKETLTAAVQEELTFPLLLGCEYVLPHLNREQEKKEKTGQVNAVETRARKRSVAPLEAPQIATNSQPEEIRELQQTDVALAGVREKVKDGTVDQAAKVPTRFREKKGLIYKEVEKGDECVSQLVVPTQKRAAVLQLGHESLGSEEGTRAAHKRSEEGTRAAHKSLAQVQGKQAQRYNKKSKERTFPSGDEVLLPITEQHNKLQLSWRGPYTVVGQKGGQNYVIAREKNKQKTYHVNMLKRYMRRLLDPLEEPGVDNFMDDLLIATETWDEHLRVWAAVLQRLSDTGLTARPSKCHIGFKTLDYLGHTLTWGQLGPDEAKVKQAHALVFDIARVCNED